MTSNRVQSRVESTEEVEARHAFEFWRSTALAPFGDSERVNRREPFAARRLAAAGPDWALTHTRSSPVGIEVTPRHIARTPSETIVIGLALAGVGYQEQSGRGARITAGDITFLSRARPFVTGIQSDYEEIRIAVPRATFEARIGSADDFAGRCLSGHAAQAPFKASLRAFAGSAADASEEEAGVAVEGILHLLRSLAAGARERWDTEVSREAIASLARGQIERRLRDPQLDPAAIQRALGLSRAHLYRAFAETGGVAAAIRDARLDLVHRRLTSRGSDGLMIATIAYECGFLDVAAFNHAFRRRFGLTPRDVRASRSGTGGDALAPPPETTR